MNQIDILIIFVSSLIIGALMMLTPLAYSNSLTNKSFEKIVIFIEKDDPNNYQTDFTFRIDYDVPEEKERLKGFLQAEEIFFVSGKNRLVFILRKERFDEKVTEWKSIFREFRDRFNQLEFYLWRSETDPFIEIDLLSL